MGVTIHYQGRLKNEMAYDMVRNIATAFAKKQRVAVRKYIRIKQAS